MGSVKDFQLVSRAICRACRESASFTLSVEADTPRRLFPIIANRGSGGGSNRGGGGMGSTRALRSRGSEHVPTMRIVSLTWNRPLRDLAGGLTLPDSLLRISFWQHFNAPVDEVRERCV